MSKVVRVGVVGCGEVSQTIHLPTLRDLPDLFEVTALCDVSGRVLDQVGAQWASAKRFGDHKSLVRDSGVDAVLIANPHVYHAEVALDAMAAGKHVLVEKPMCVNLREAEALIERKSQYGVVAQVGFMRRYAGLYRSRRARRRHPQRHHIGASARRDRRQSDDHRQHFVRIS